MSGLKRFQISFGIKLAIIISVISVGITTVSVYVFYSSSQQIILQQMRDRLKGIGQTGSYLLTDRDREHLKFLNQIGQQETTAETLQKIRDLPLGGSTPGFSAETSQRYMRSPEFQQVVQVLRQINQSSRSRLDPLTDSIPQSPDGLQTDPYLALSYIYAPIADSPNPNVYRSLASSLYEPAPNWIGNPYGTLYYPPQPAEFAQALQGETVTSRDFYTDDWGTWLSAFVPVKDRDGSIIAILGVDLDISGPANQLRQLQLICASIIVASFLVSLFLAALISRWLGSPIAKLRIAAEKVRDRDLSHRVEIDRKDELGLLATTFNAMIAEIRLYADSLQVKNQELTEALDKLQHSQLQLVQQEKMSTLGGLVAGIAHEINNPVSFLAGNVAHALGYIQNLFNLIHLYQTHCPNLNPEIQAEIEAIDLEYIQTDLPKLMGSMNTGIERIQSLSTSLRTFSRSDSDRPVLFDLHEGLDSTLLILKHRLKANQERPAIEVIKDYANLPQIQCYAGQLNQVFMNIIANAIDAVEDTNQGKSYQEITNQIHIKTALLPDQTAVQIRIQDNGVGMSAETQQHVFDYLFTTKVVGKGTGLGLAIAHQIIVEKHQGQVEIRSVLGQGSTFIITLPLNLN
jgi:signal transduction histidine kinase